MFFEFGVDVELVLGNLLRMLWTECYNALMFKRYELAGKVKSDIKV